MGPREIKRLRRKLGITADKMAEMLGYEGKYRRDTIYRLESGKIKPTRQTLILLKQFL